MIHGLGVIVFLLNFRSVEGGHFCGAVAVV